VIHTRSKKYQVTLWLTPDRSGLATHAEFDDREAAEEAFRVSRLSAQYKAGLLAEWDKQRGDWTLIDYYP
jgi:hypothetical protein